ncbi:T-cell surface glycoprotein CD3 zeta chain isoform 2-T2 [Liasis olivaceus]
MGFALPVKTVRRTKQLRCHFFPCPAICSIVAFSLLPHPQLACNLGEKMKLKGILINAILQALLPITDADALGLTDPKLCYILDGILLIYAIIITVLFMKVKLGNHPDESKPSQNANDIYNKLSSGHRDEYDLLGVKKTDTDLEMAGENQRRRKKPQDKVYTSLQRDKMGEAYSEIGKKGERHRGKGNDILYQGLSPATKDTYSALQMQQIHPH